MPAKAGIHNSLKILDSRLRGNDDFLFMQGFLRGTPSDGFADTSLGEGGFCSGSDFAKCARALSRRD